MVWVVTEDMGRWGKNHQCDSETTARQKAIEIHARRDRPLCPAVVFIRHPNGKEERV